MGFSHSDILGHLTVFLLYVTFINVVYDFTGPEVVGFFSMNLLNTEKHYNMLSKIFFPALALLFLSVPGFNQAIAEDSSPVCIQLDEKASGAMINYSLHGEANGPVFFSGISCAIEHRNRELCAMEMVSFDTTAKVYDYNTAEETDISKAYFWLDEKNSATPVVAFGSKENAEKYGTEKKGGLILDYTGLTDREFK